MRRFDSLFRGACYLDESETRLEEKRMAGIPEALK